MTARSTLDDGDAELFGVSPEEHAACCMRVRARARLSAEAELVRRDLEIAEHYADIAHLFAEMARNRVAEARRRQGIAARAAYALAHELDAREAMLAGVDLTEAA